MRSLGPSLPLSGSGCHLPDPASGRDGLVHSLLALLWYTLSPLFYGGSGQQCLRLGLFPGYFVLSLSLFFPLSLWLPNSLGCYLTIARAM